MKKKEQFIIGYDRQKRRITSYISEEEAEMYSIYWKLIVNESGYKEAKAVFQEIMEEHQSENN